MEVWAWVRQHSASWSEARSRDGAGLPEPRTMASQSWILTLLVGSYAQAQNLLHSKKELTHLVVGETLGT